MIKFIAALSVVFGSQFALAQADGETTGSVSKESAPASHVDQSAEQALSTNKSSKQSMFLGVVDSNGIAGDLGANGTTLTAGLMYKLEDKSMVGFSQDVESSLNMRTADLHGNPVGRTTRNDLGWTTARYQMGPKKLWGSDNIFGLARYYIPTSLDTRWMQDLDGSKFTSSQGNLRFDFEIPWMLSPHWTVSYAATPRFNFVSANDPTFDFGRGYARYNQYGYLYYVANDTLKFYGYYGYENRWGTNENMRMFAMKAIPGAGLIKDFSKSTGIQAEVTHVMSLISKDMSGASQEVNNYDLRPENLAYEITLYTLL